MHPPTQRPQPLGQTLLRLGAGLLALIAAACGHADPATRLQVTLRPDHGAAIAVHGKDGLQVAVVANRAWRGADAVHAGLFGERCPAQVEPELANAGAGTLLLGVVTGGVLTGEIPAARLATLPTPLVLQAVTAEVIDGRTWLVLSNALLLTSEREGHAIVPFPITFQLWAAAGPFGCYVLLPLAAALLLSRVRSRRLQHAARWAMLAAMAVAVVLRCVPGDSAPLWPRWTTEPLATLERSYGTGLANLVHAARAQRVAGEPITLLVDPSRRSEQQSLAAHLQVLLGDTLVTDAAASLRPGSLCIVITAQTAPIAALTPPALQGVELLHTAVGDLWRLESK